MTIGVGEDIFVHAAIRRVKVIEEELLHVGEQVAAVKEREDASTRGQRSILRWAVSSHFGRAEFHPVFFAEAFDLSVTEHGQAGQGRQHRAHAEIFVAIAELLDGGFFIGVVHEVDVTLENLRVELQRVLDRHAILGVIFVAQHVHERGVVDAVHPQRADEVAFHQPEGFGEQQRIGDFRCDTVHDLAPELFGDRRQTRLLVMPCSERRGIAPPAPGSGNHKRWMCFLASVIAASKRMTGKLRATCRMV